MGTLADATITRFPRQDRIRTSQGRRGILKREEGSRDRPQKKDTLLRGCASLKRTSRANGPGEMTTKNRENIAD